jgi:hypothetical protein
VTRPIYGKVVLSNKATLPSNRELRVVGDKQQLDPPLFSVQTEKPTPTGRDAYHPIGSTETSGARREEVHRSHNNIGIGFRPGGDPAR